MIPDYLDSLGAVLKFDRSLARRVRQEVEDHLWEAVAADPAGSEVEAQRRAIAAFGEPRVIAAQFAVVSLAARTRRAGGAMILLIGGVFLAMKARVAWYAVMDCIVGDDLKAISAVVGLVDRCSFWLSAVIAIGAWMYFSFHHSPARPQIAYRRQSRRFCLFCGVAAGALVVSVISDGVLTALRLPGPALSAEFLIPVLSILIEISCAAVLACQIGGVAQRAASMAALLKT